MKLGNGDKASWNKDVNGKNKVVAYVKPQDLMTQSASMARGGRMDIKNGAVKPMMPSNRDTYQ